MHIQVAHAVPQAADVSTRRCMCGLATTPAERATCRRLTTGEHPPRVQTGRHVVPLEQQDFLAVWDTLDNRILASVRLLGDHVLRFGGRFELSTLFDLRALTGTGRGRLLELDRLAVAPFERSHPHAVRLLCRTVASLVELNSIDAVLTAVHVPRSCGDGYLQAVTQELWHHARDSALPTARPWVKLPLGESATPERYVLPSAMKLLLRLGAVVYPEPAWDAERNMASYLFVLTREHRNARSWQRLIKA